MERDERESKLLTPFAQPPAAAAAVMSFHPLSSSNPLSSDLLCSALFQTKTT